MPPKTNQQEKRIAVVSGAIGQKYLDVYNKNFRASHEYFAQKNNYGFFVVTKHIDESLMGKSRHPAWQALLIFQIPELKNYDYLLWVDGDVYIKRESLSPVDSLISGKWLAAKNNAYNLESLAKTDLCLYKDFPKETRPDFCLNLGVFLVERKSHQELLEKVYKNFEEQSCYYQGPLSFYLLKEYPGIILSPYFNAVLTSYLEKNGRTLSNIIKFYQENGFIHFAGGINLAIVKLIKILDTRPTSFQAKVATLLGSKKLDHVNFWLLKFISKLSRFILKK